MSDNKRIAKNTFFLYVRMIVSMIIALYTSRVVLQRLGVDDFGIYQAVGGVVGFLSFLNAAISTGSSRFLTYELGVGNLDKLKRTFSTLLTAHFILASLIVVVAETVGLWFVYNKMVIPDERFESSIIVFHISILTAVLNLTQVPYNATIIAHEKMGVFALVSIFDAIGKLLICYLIGIGGSDHLVSYAILMFVEQASVLLFYRVYCTKHYPESVYHFSLDKEILKPVLSFSGWSLFGSGAYALTRQGVLVLLNMFFSPAIVSARAISVQVNSAAIQLVNNFQTAANPQIVKLYAQHDYQGSRTLLLQMTKLSFFLMLLICVPIFFLTDPLLHLWLENNVPDYTSIFLKIVIIQSLFEVFDSSFYIALYTRGRLKENAIISPLTTFIVFPIVYILFKGGSSPIVLSWAYLISFAILGLFVKPLLIVKIAGYNWKEIFGTTLPCLFVAGIVFSITLSLDVFFDKTTVCGSICELITDLLITIIACLYLGLDKNTRSLVFNIIRTKIFKK